MNKGRAQRFLRILNDELTDRDFVAGDRFTIADITGLVACQFMRPARIDMPEECGHVMAWLERVASRPSAAFD